MMTLPKLNGPTIAPGTTGTNSSVKCPNYDCYTFTDGNFLITLWVQEGIIKLAPACWMEWQGKGVELIEAILIQAGFKLTKTLRTC